MEHILNYFNQAAETWSRYRRRKAYYWDNITRYCNFFIPRDHKVLEIGCATGDLLAGLEATDKTGIDFSPEMIKRARAKWKDIRFEVMPAEDIKLEEKYDTIIMSNLVGVLPDVQKVFSELQKVSHSRTRIIVTYYNRLWEPFLKLAEWLRLKRTSPLQNWLSTNDLKNLLYLSGFETYRVNKNMLIPFYIPGISWFFNRILSRLPLIRHLSLNNYIFARPAPNPHQEDSQLSVSVIIPARNESGNIENAIKRMPRFGKHLEIIFVEGNSTDNTWEVINQVKEKYSATHDIKAFRQPGKGKGDAVREGFKQASGDILMILDADLTVPPEDLPRFYHALASGKGELINGVRLVYPMEKNAMRPLNTLGNYFFSIAFSWLLEQPVKDTLCGTKVMFKSDYLQLARNRPFFGEFDPFGDFDLLFGAYKLNLKIIDLPVRYRERTYGNTNISRFSHGFILLKMAMFAAAKIKFW
ncbi:bifunctional class I SAM-dependent methyltransferase/glycosyltransferase family 2 protein [Thermophagus xiamenensis]|uniref:Methyltransferase domain-containing protein n=1 Tax=Thermophagus xiamenensis TaxID=385682 RepID=A0A1I1UJS5_9BACT|nr:bifunctional class I SAM-dependent methyltransferase/glycosyltransferase family 2 protein [Thermophagus xiamenensis]SFD71051.1 Methyltransferase domain-containing protein [Thermophagus xiamenensis]